MHCYECSREGKSREALGLCHHCSAALCSDHARVVADPVTTSYPIAKRIAFPKKARLLLCVTCLEALEQARSENPISMSKTPCTPAHA